MAQREGIASLGQFSFYFRVEKALKDVVFEPHRTSFQVKLSSISVDLEAKLQYQLNSAPTDLKTES